MTVLAVMLLAGDFAVNKLYQKKYGTDIEAGLKFNALLGLFTAAIFFAGSGLFFVKNADGLGTNTCDLAKMWYNCSYTNESFVQHYAQMMGNRG